MGAEPAGTPSERTRRLLAKLGRPELRLPPVVHVGGTKGKGSTIAFLRAMLEAAGYRVHAYTSPHLSRFNERIVLAGREIGDDQLYETLEETRAAAADMPVGFFDATTAAALLAMAAMPADIVLMEMGLGGLVDATNIIDNPLLTILTTVSYDHMEYMGTTLPSIAAFEAGLMKPDTPCVVSFQHDSVAHVLKTASEAIHAPLYAYGTHWRTRRTHEGWAFADAHGEAALPAPSLLGAHQIVNAGNAVAALSLMEHFDVGPEHIMQGLREARWKGRLERMRGSLLPAGSELWFDGGHNMAAGQAIAFFVAEHWRDKPFYLIFGTTQGKDVAAVLEPFASLAERIYAVGVKSEPKSYPPEAIAAAAKPLLDVTPEDSIDGALRDIMARERAQFRALVFGSLYLWLEANAQ
jgi:dihydrofolate synthase/folylpolyglutamate synthase